MKFADEFVNVIDPLAPTFVRMFCQSIRFELAWMTRLRPPSALLACTFLRVELASTLALLSR